ncbi:MAG: cysteine desulfurase family protein [Actinomycetota bacterium]|nr:cysteine desulfurase family protein [Actinomycetota bacterium]
MENQNLIYLDNASSTKIDDRVIKEMLPFILEHYGNPSSVHQVGADAREGLDRARERIANLIGATPEEIYFTSCGSESNNFALKGISEANQNKGKHIISSVIEHISILNPLKELNKNGYETTIIPVDKEGFVDPEEIKKAIRPETVMISIMHANNEIGTIQQVKEISQIAHEAGIIFHSDGIATAGIIPLNVSDLGIDALSFSSQQMYGPKGAAALYVRKGIRIKPFILGGVQEKGRRAGTENVAGIAGFGKACEIAKIEMSSINEKLVKLRDKLFKGITENINEVVSNGSMKNRLPGNVHVSFKYIEGESIVLFLNMQKIMVATGSSCASQALKVSHVCTSIGLDHATAQGSILFSMGKYNTETEIEKVIEVLPPIIDKLRKMSPLYKN